MKTKIPIFYTVDNNYVPYLAVSILSLIDHTSKDTEYNIHIIYENLDNEAIKKLKSLEKENVTLEFLSMEEKIKPLKEKLSVMIKKTHFPITIYFRIFLPFMFPMHDKGIYIDSDTVLNADIKEFYNIDLKDNLFGGCVDKSVYNTPITNYYENYSGIKKDEYINSGVLLMNMKKLREIKFENRFIEILSKYDFEFVEPDQAYINNLSYGHILYIDNEWNAMPVQGKKGMDNPKLIHYNLFLKPWHYADVGYNEYFWKYAKKSDYYELIKNELNSYSLDDKNKDSETFNRMIAQANRLATSDISPNKVFNEQKEKRAL